VDTLCLQALPEALQCEAIDRLGEACRRGTVRNPR
jgi:hypothetical protein